MIPLSDSINININVTINDADNLIESVLFTRVSNGFFGI